MKRKKLLCAGMTILLFLFFSFPVSYALDELVLKGIVLNMNAGLKTVRINVHSQSCPGPRNFTFSVFSGLNNTMIGKRITFRIDASNCRSNAMPKILKVR